MVNEILGAVKLSQGEVSNDKVREWINKDNKKCSGGDDREDPPVKKRGKRLSGHT